MTYYTKVKSLHSQLKITNKSLSIGNLEVLVCCVSFNFLCEEDLDDFKTQSMNVVDAVCVLAFSFFDLFQLVNFGHGVVPRGQKGSVYY